VGNARGTDFCDVVRNKPHDLKNALVGRNLSVAVQYGPGFNFFIYNQEEGLSATNPSGMIANVLDELASRAGFSWRNSFVAYNTTTTDILVGKGAGKWDRMLKQLTSRFDLSVDKWYLTSERLENQTVFLRSWFDSSLILVDQGNELKINWFGFKEPFQDSVWTGIIATILMSAIFMIIIESLEDRRDGRTLKSWFSDHLYLTFLAFNGVLLDFLVVAFLALVPAVWSSTALSLASSTLVANSSTATFVSAFGNFLHWVNIAVTAS